MPLKRASVRSRTGYKSPVRSPSWESILFIVVSLDHEKPAIEPVQAAQLKLHTIPRHRYTNTQDVPFTLSVSLSLGKTLRKPTMNTGSTHKADTPSLQDPITTTQQIVTFSDDSVPKEERLAAPSTDNTALQDSRKENRTHSIEDILARPYKVHSSSWSTNSAAGSKLFEVKVPQVLLDQPNIAAKIAGFLTMRFTTHLKVVFNATKYQQGRALLTFYPQPENDAQRKKILDSNLTSLTQRPKVDIDIQVDSDVTFTIPYVSPYLGYNFAENTGQLGSFEMWVYSPMTSVTGSTIVPYTVYMWFTDLEVQYPTYVPQVLGSSSKSSDPALKEAANPGVGTISSLSGTVSTAMKGLVPLYSSVQALPPWAKALATGAAAAFGFSKPISDHMVTKIENSVFMHTNHADGGSFARNLGINANNSVAHMSGFAGQNVDEMDFSYLSCIPSYYSRTSWTTAQGAEDVLFRLPIYPSYYSHATMDSLITHTPMSYLARYFRLWRGSLMFHFKLVKTQFHSGRLIVSWQPGNDINLPNTPPNPNYCYTQIIDIQDTNEISFTVPYVATTPYKNVGKATGLLWVQVLNMLQAPDVVSASIDIICEVCGGPDLEFAQPINPLITPVIASESAPAVQMMKMSALTGDEIYDAEPVASELREGDSQDGIIWLPQGGDETPPRKKVLTPPRSPAFDRFTLGGNVDAAVMAKYTTNEQIAMAKELQDSDDWSQNRQRMEIMALITSNFFPYPYDDWGTGFTAWNKKGQFGPCGDLASYVRSFHRKIGCSLATFLEDASGRREIQFSARGQSQFKKLLANWGPHIEQTIWEPQAAGERPCEGMETATVMTAGPTLVPDAVEPDVSHAAYCIGERITSLRTLTKRFTPWIQFGAIGNTNTAHFRSPVFSLPETTGNLIDRQVASVDYINAFAPMFRYWRGSLRYILYFSTNSSMNANFRVSFDDLNSAVITGNNIQTIDNNSGKYYDQRLNLAIAHEMATGGIEVQVPFFSRTYTAHVDLNSASNPASSNVTYPSGMVSFKAPSAGGATYVHRAAGEDFSFGFFLGVPQTKNRNMFPPTTVEPGSW